MTWVVALALAAIAFVFAVVVLRAPRRGWEAIGAALLFGVAGYALQASPGVPASPTLPHEQISGDPAALVKARRQVTKSGIPPTDRWVVIADALARRGQFADAAEILRGSVEKDPRNAEAWLAMANALVAHANDTLTPAALYAFRRASTAAPEHPGPPYFLGLALAQSGQFTQARAVWGQLLAATPPDAPWSADLRDKLARLDGIIAAQGVRQQTGAGRR